MCQFLLTLFDLIGCRNDTHIACTLAKIAPALKSEFMETLLLALDDVVYANLGWAKTSNTIYKEKILEALGGMGPNAKEAVPKLREFLHHPWSMTYRNAARAALMKIDPEKEWSTSPIGVGDR